MRARILGLGEWLPPTVRANEDWPAEFAGRPTSSYGSELAEIGVGDADPCDRIVARWLSREANDPFRGTRRRRVADASMSAAEAEATAGKRALEDAGVPASDIDWVLSWSMVPDRVTPPTAPRVAHLVGATRAAGIGMDAACATTIAQIALATGMIESGRARHVLLTQSHLIARANPLMHPASPIVGDAATAMVLGPSDRPGVVELHLASHGEYHEAVTWTRGRDAEAPWWEAGPDFVPGTKNRDQAAMLSRKLVHYAQATVKELMEKAGVPLGSIAVLASAQPRRWFPWAIAESLGLPESAAPHTFDELAHVGGCGIVTNLIEARRRALLQPETPVVLYAMGAGITRAAALLSW